MPAATALAIVELRRRLLTQAFIAARLGVSCSSVSRVLARAGLSKLADLAPAAPVQRYEHAAPGDLLHIDTKKLGRIERPATGSPATGAKWCAAPAGNSCSWRWTITPASALPTCTRTSAPRRHRLAVKLNLQR
jgi:hypothetical protein